MVRHHMVEIVALGFTAIVVIGVAVTALYDYLNKHYDLEDRFLRETERTE